MYFLVKSDDSLEKYHTICKSDKKMNLIESLSTINFFFKNQNKISWW